MQSPSWWSVAFGCLRLIAFGVLFAVIVPGVTKSSGQAASAQSADKISNLDDARRFVTGTWTYTGQGTPYHTPLGTNYTWIKIVIKPDGTFDWYAVHPTDEDWGKPVTYRYTLFTDKYADTGQRFYGLKWSESEYTERHLSIEDGGTLRYVIKTPSPGFGVPAVDWDISFTRGDQQPFSK